MAVAIGLSLPATVQHFLVWRDPDHFFGARETFRQRAVNLRSANVGGHGVPADRCAPG